VSCISYLHAAAMPRDDKSGARSIQNTMAPDLRRGDDVFVLFIPQTRQRVLLLWRGTHRAGGGLLFFLIFFKAPRRRMGTFYLQNLNTVIPAQAGIHCFIYSFVIASKLLFAWQSSFMYSSFTTLSLAKKPSNALKYAM
ncbi:MAG: hypothetical protein IJX43_03590, partial [Alphaproteobacteria bacterium]|nr:hypothetical protein [Alphaproteobacteria bacterium]